MTVTHNDRPSVTAAVCQDEHYTEGETKTFLSFFTVSKKYRCFMTPYISRASGVCVHPSLHFSVAGRKKPAERRNPEPTSSAKMILYLLIFFPKIPQHSCLFLPCASSLRLVPRWRAAVMSACLGHLKVSSLGGFIQSSLAYIMRFNLSFSVAKLVGNELRWGTEEPSVIGDKNMWF